MTELEIRELGEVADLAAVARLFDSIWGGKPVSVELLRAMAVAGNYIAGAYEADKLLGACFGFLGETGLHSHIAGVASHGLGRGVGYALKQHQRRWALDRGLGTISWTYDPLVRRNGHFNLTKLGARPVSYIPDFYGRMNDSINGSDETDRLLVAWDLNTPQRTIEPAGATTALSVGDDGGPVAGGVDGSVLRVAVPPDIEALRRTDPALARSWRVALREVLQGLMVDGEVVGFDRAGWYLIVRERK
ncbi:GNAT family N-acetyltransferase [Kutzneria buriramensis]|nr:GNAT family N-acetyltransferase [Kutzneria buriramensis]